MAGAMVLLVLATFPVFAGGFWETDWTAAVSCTSEMTCACPAPDPIPPNTYPTMTATAAARMNSPRINPVAKNW